MKTTVERMPMDWKDKKDKLESILSFIHLFKLELEEIQEAMLGCTENTEAMRALWSRQRYILGVIKNERLIYDNIKKGS